MQGFHSGAVDDSNVLEQEAVYTSTGVHVTTIQWSLI